MASWSFQVWGWAGDQGRWKPPGWGVGVLRGVGRDDWLWSEASPPPPACLCVHTTPACVCMSVRVCARVCARARGWRGGDRSRGYSGGSEGPLIPAGVYTARPARGESLEAFRGGGLPESLRYLGDVLRGDFEVWRAPPSQIESPDSAFRPILAVSFFGVPLNQRSSRLRGAASTRVSPTSTHHF